MKNATQRPQGFYYINGSTAPLSFVDACKNADWLAKHRDYAQTVHNADRDVVYVAKA